MRVWVMCLSLFLVLGSDVDAQSDASDTWAELFQSSRLEPDLGDLGYEPCGVGEMPDSLWLSSDHAESGFIGHGFALGSEAPVIMPIEVLPREHETVGVELAGVWCQGVDSPRIHVTGLGGRLMLFAVERPSRFGRERMPEALEWVLTRTSEGLTPVRLERSDSGWSVTPSDR